MLDLRKFRITWVNWAKRHQKYAHNIQLNMSVCEYKFIWTCELMNMPKVLTLYQSCVCAMNGQIN